MINENFIEKLRVAREFVNKGLFIESYKITEELLCALNEMEVKDDAYFIMIYNLSGNFIDIGGMQPNHESALIGFNLMKENKSKLISLLGESGFYYNYANAKENLVSIKNPFDMNFSTIDEMVEVKNYFWKSSVSMTNEELISSPNLKVNLANSLKRQFRVVEALAYYDDVNKLGCDIPQSWINRSETLMLLNNLSGNYSIKMMREVRVGYLNVLSSKQVPPQWFSYYKQCAEKLTMKIDGEINDEGRQTQERQDDEETLEEYNSLGEYKRFCISNYLTLSEHGLYCPCSVSSIDDLTIPNSEKGIIGEFVIPMEMVLNRLKSEFSLARQLYYEYCRGDALRDVEYETHYSELFNDEVLGVEVEKLRTAFRLCFGILDKIALAICELYDLAPPNGVIYFQNFWQLDKNNRRESFEKIKSPGILALYSIATDLNDRKNGELSFYKKWRNDLEHKIVIVHKNEKPNDMYNSYGFIKDIIFINEGEFVRHFKQLIQITRSAIFSFVFTVRDKGRFDGETNDYFKGVIDWKIK